MGSIFSIFSKPKKPRAPAPGPAEKAQKKTSAKRAQLLALKSTGSGGLTDEANVGRKRILV